MSSKTKSPKIKLGFLASHSGSGMRAVIEACQTGQIQAQPHIVISNNSTAPALDYAKRDGLHTVHLSSSTHPNADALDLAMLHAFSEVDWIICSGYMRKIGPCVLEHFQKRILNVHPSLLPAFGGHGLYGDRVHQAVLKAGLSETGATVHFVDAEYDTGPILAQIRVPVFKDDSLDSLRSRVQVAEQALLVNTLQALLSNTL